MQAFNTKLFDGTVILSLNKPKMGNKRKGDMGKVECDADKSRLDLSKKLLNSASYEAITTFYGTVDKWVKARCAPSPFKGGMFLVKVEMVPLFREALDGFRKTLKEELVPNLVSVYPSLIETAKAELRDQWDERDYPTIEQLPGLFDITYNWLTIGVPESLPESIQREERAKIEAQFKQTEELVLSALREGFAKLIDHAIDKLAPDGDGKPKRFFKTTITNITDFIETFGARNLMDDQQLKELVDKAKSVLDPVNPMLVKDNDSVRESIVGQFTAIQAELDKLIVERPKRKFDFSGE